MHCLLALLSLVALASAQFGQFFEQMFNQHHHGGHQQPPQPQQNPSDASLYQLRYDQSVCDKFLCPDTLACVDFPHHCPCAWEAQQEKFEMAEGQRICVSRGGYKAGEAARKVELARKGLL